MSTSLLFLLSCRVSRGGNLVRQHSCSGFLRVVIVEPVQAQLFRQGCRAALQLSEELLTPPTITPVQDSTVSIYFVYHLECLIPSDAGILSKFSNYNEGVTANYVL